LTNLGGNGILDSRKSWRQSFFKRLSFSAKVREKIEYTSDNHSNSGQFVRTAAIAGPPHAQQPGGYA
jgi:hypothetical protein